MRKILVLALAAAGICLSQAASAADLGTAPVYRKAPPAPVWSWTGSYIGGFVGGATSAGDTRTSDPFALANPQASYKLGTSFIGGTTSGYNWQFAPNWLIGYEGETGYIDLKSTGALPANPAFFGETRMGQFYSAWTARFGYVMDKSLFYVKGGATLTRFETGVFNTAVPFGIEDHKYVFGYAVGAGWEYAIDPKWSVKAEYLYLGYDKDFTYTGVTNGGVFTATTHFSGVHTGKVGLLYKFDWFSLLR
jgi:outer membrane immunogenic protein